jgi:hypothetical protein
MLRKIILANFQRIIELFTPKLSTSSQKYGFGIRDPRSGIRKEPIPDPGVKKAPDLGSGSAKKRWVMHGYVVFCNIPGVDTGTEEVLKVIFIFGPALVSIRTGPESRESLITTALCGSGYCCHTQAMRAENFPTLPLN